MSMHDDPSMHDVPRPTEADALRQRYARSQVQDFTVCAETADGKHRPGPAGVHDPGMPPGYYTIQCQACAQTTGHPMPDPEDIEWD